MNIVEAVQSADRALGPRLLYRLFEGAMEFEDSNKRIKTAMVILLAGRLTMRLKTIQHIREAWINWARGEIIVPKFDACDCYRCWVEAYQWWLRQGLHTIEDWDDNKQPEWFSEDKKLTDYVADEKEKIPELAGLDPQDLVDYLSQKKHDPKTPSGGRVIPFGWSPRITAVLLTFFNRFECIEESQRTLNNWLTEAAENARGVNPEPVSAHGLRADGLTFFIRLTGDPQVGGEIGGQSDWQSINRYKAMLDRITTEQVYHAAGKGEWAPPAIPEKPGQRFPLALDESFIGNEWKDYDPAIEGYPDARMERHQEQKDEQISLYHPRGDLHDSKPWDRAGFPDRNEINYDRYEDHEIPGSANEDYEFIEGEPVTRTSTIAEFTDPHDVPRTASSEVEHQQSELGDRWEQMNMMLSPQPLLEKVQIDSVQTVLHKRRRELLTYGEAIVKILNPATADPDWARLKTIGRWWGAVIVLLAMLFSQAGLYGDTVKQVVLSLTLLTAIAHLPWGSIDIEQAFRNRSRTSPTAPFQFD